MSHHDPIAADLDDHSEWTCWIVFDPSGYYRYPFMFDSEKLARQWISDSRRSPNHKPVQCRVSVIDRSIPGIAFEPGKTYQRSLLGYIQYARVEEVFPSGRALATTYHGTDPWDRGQLILIRPDEQWTPSVPIAPAPAAHGG